MTLSGKPVCPRCGQPIEIGAQLHKIKAHRDKLTRAACPTEGMDLVQARHWVEDARRRIREMSA